MTRKIYVDSNILIAYFTTGVGAEKVRKRRIINAFKVISQLGDVKFYISMWTINEFVKVMINEKRKLPKEINKIANNLVQKTIIEKTELEILGVCPDSEYTFNDFFYDVREVMTLYNPGFGDAFHSVIMRNHSIKEILSLDGKDDFNIIPGITVIPPATFVKPVLEISVSN